MPGVLPWCVAHTERKSKLDFLNQLIQWPPLSLSLSLSVCPISTETREFNKKESIVQHTNFEPSGKVQHKHQTMDYLILMDHLELISLHLEYRKPSLISPIDDHKQGNNFFTRSTPKFHRKGLQAQLTEVWVHKFSILFE